MGTLTKKSTSWDSVSFREELLRKKKTLCYTVLKRKSWIFFRIRRRVCLNLFVLYLAVFLDFTCLYFPRFQLICLYSIYISCCQCDTFFPIIYIYAFRIFTNTVYVYQAFLVKSQAFLVKSPLIKGNFWPRFKFM